MGGTNARKGTFKPIAWGYIGLREMEWKMGAGISFMA